jgi:hypothetical protein
MALRRPEAAGKLVEEAIASKQNFIESQLLFQGRHLDPLLCQQLRRRMEDAAPPP